MSTHLIPAESDALAECEAVIERGLATFVETGQALLRVRDDRLYRTDHATFESYCEHRWGISRPQAYRLIAAADVAQIVEAGSVSPMGDTGINERQTRELSSLLPAATATPEEREAAHETVREVYREAVERTEGKPTAAAIRDVRQEREKPAEPTQAQRQVHDILAGDAGVREANLKHGLATALAAAARLVLTPAEELAGFNDPDSHRSVAETQASLDRWFARYESAKPSVLRAVRD